MKDRVYFFLINKLGLITRFCNQAITIVFFLRYKPYQIYSNMNIVLFLAYL